MGVDAPLQPMTDKATSFNVLEWVLVPFASCTKSLLEVVSYVVGIDCLIE